MATDFNTNAIASGGGFKPSPKDTPTRIGERIETLEDITSIPNPWVGMIVYVRDTGKRYEVLSIKDVQQGLSQVSSVDQYGEIVDKEYVDDAIANAQLSDGEGSVDLEGYAKIDDIPTKVSELENDKGYLTQIPSEYITETELNNKNYATNEQMNNAILDYTDGKKQRYKTQEQYDALSDEEKNDPNIIWNITDANDEMSQTQVDWNETNDTSNAYIKNKPDIPTKTSELINDSNFAVQPNFTYKINMISANESPFVTTEGEYPNLTITFNIPFGTGSSEGEDTGGTDENIGDVNYNETNEELTISNNENVSYSETNEELTIVNGASYDSNEENLTITGGNN